MHKSVNTVLAASAALLLPAFAGLSLAGLMRHHHSQTGYRRHDVYLLRPSQWGFSHQVLGLNCASEWRAGCVGVSDWSESGICS